jgi:hypothetical protein
MTDFSTIVLLSALTGSVYAIEPKHRYLVVHSHELALFRLAADRPIVSDCPGAQFCGPQFGHGPNGNAAIEFGPVKVDTNLEDQFLAPPKNAYPETWFHLIGGNVNREALTNDLEVVAEARISGIQFFKAKDELGRASTFRFKRSARRGIR